MADGGDARPGGARARGRLLRVGAAVLAALLFPGCLDLPQESKDLLQVFIVLLAVNIFFQMVLFVLLLFYFLPFTRPARRRRRK